MDIKDIADLLIERLKDLGFVIQRYDAYSTNSIYLKLDYGVCNSIRISDHLGKRYLKYRYNLLTNLKLPYKDKDKFVRYYYTPNTIDNMLDQIIKDKNDKLSKYGVLGYSKFMMENVNKHRNDTTGFWKDSKLVL